MRRIAQAAEQRFKSQSLLPEDSRRCQLPRLSAGRPPDIPSSHDLSLTVEIPISAIALGAPGPIVDRIGDRRDIEGEFASPNFGQASLSLIGALHGFQPWQMFEARILLESGPAALAAERGKEEHHTALAEEVAEMFASLDKPLEYLIHDVLFHRIIAQASGNPILAAIMETVTSSMYDRRRKTVERATDLRESAEMHREIFRAIRARKSQEARQLMEQHLRMAQAAQGIERPASRKSSGSATPAGHGQ